MRRRHLGAWLLLAIWLVGVPALQAKKKDEPNTVLVQHILVAFKKTVKNKPIDRTKKEAQALAEELLQRAQAGEDFDALVKEYTNDSYPGLYLVTNRDAPLLPDSVPRSGLVTSFGDVAFSLEVGEVGMARYHPGNSPFGWHIIKRIE